MNRKGKVFRGCVLPVLLLALFLCACGGQEAASSLQASHGGQGATLPGIPPESRQMHTEEMTSEERVTEDASTEATTAAATLTESPVPAVTETAPPPSTTETSAPPTREISSASPSRPTSEHPVRPTPERPLRPTEDTDILRNKVADYSDKSNWAWLALGEGKIADVFFVGPTVVDEGRYFHLSDETAREAFLISIGKEKALYDELGCLYAPFYRQMAIEVYGWPLEEQTFWRDQAYRDVSAAFRYFLDHYEMGRPLVLAGFSQGAEMCIRLLKEFFDPDTEEGCYLQSRLVAVYAIGAGLPESVVEACPWIRAAEGETDLGGVICFDCEQPGISGSVLLPAGSRSLSINPLSWSRDTEPADEGLNKGAYFPGIDLEIPQFCGCYIEPERGALIVTGINPAYYPTDTTVLPEGNLHEYDYQFFYRNLQENVIKRIEAFLAAQ